MPVRDERPGGQTEHFVTFFDHGFILQGMALHASLRQWSPHSWLWVLCLDEEAQRQLEALALPGLSIIPLAAFETPELLEAKRGRSRTEYIYTLTPFTFAHVFAADPDARRVTYVDADLFFFRDPQDLLRDFEASGRSVLITEHGFAPEYRHLERNAGRFCVQFLTAVRGAAADRVLRSWQEDCLASTSTAADTRSVVFGDQRYLEDWPARFPDAVYVSPHHRDMQAPWNVTHEQRLPGGPHRPVFYHFHSLRVLGLGWVQWCAGYRIGRGVHLYREYVTALREAGEALAAAGVSPAPGARREAFWAVRMMWRVLTGRVVLRRSLRSVPSRALR